MVIRYCPHCQTRYTVMPHTGDFVHQCNSGNNTLDQEDVVIISTTVEEEGVDISTGKLKSDITKQGAENTLFGNRAYIEGGDENPTTARGNDASITRQRQHYHYIKY